MIVFPLAINLYNMYILYKFRFSLLPMTTSISIAEFRENMAAYLEKVKMLQKPLVFGKRNKPEFVIIPTMSDEDREMYESA